MQNSNRIDLERGRTSADRRHSVVFSGVWRLDYADSARPVAKALLNDWTVSAIITLQSGAPLTITAGQDRNFDGLTNDRADVVGDFDLDSGRPREEAIEQWFNTAAFPLPAIGQDGTASRSILDGPGYRNVDLGVFRDLRLCGRTLLQLRIETTNVLNTVNLRDPGVNFSAPTTFGKIRAPGTCEEFSWVPECPSRPMGQAHSSG